MKSLNNIALEVMDVGQDRMKIILYMCRNLLTKLFENSWEKSNLL